MNSNYSISKITKEFIAYNQEMSTEKIKQIRRIFNLTQVKFAQVLGISYDTYRNWEIGHRNPSGPAIALLYIAEKYPDIFLKNSRKIAKKLKDMIC